MNQALRQKIECFILKLKKLQAIYCIVSMMFAAKSDSDTEIAGDISLDLTAARMASGQLCMASGC